MSELKAIDTMNRPWYAKPEIMKPLFETFEFTTLANTTFAGIRERHDIREGEEWRVFQVLAQDSPEGVVEQMDEEDVEYVFMDQILQWYQHEQNVHQAISIEELAEMSAQTDGRIVPGAGYNPYDITNSLRKIERAVTELEFKYVWIQAASFGVRPDNEKFYPLYAKATELDIPVAYQTGHAAEPIPSEYGRPMIAENIAMDFPDLDIILTHTGWPWSTEWCSMLWRFPNVYGNIGAYYPSFLPDDQIEMMDSGRIRDKVLWATNGLDMGRHKEEFLNLPIGDKTKERVLRKNALEVFDLD